MRILLVRHGESEGNVDLTKYIDKGDSNIGLTETGWRQALAAGKFLKDFYAATATPKWPVIFLSSYQRPKETLSAILHGMEGTFAGIPVLQEDPRLVEKFFGAASALTYPHEKLSKDVIETLLHLSKSVYDNDPFSAKNLFGDSTKDTLVAVKGLIDGTLRRDVDQGKDDFLFVVHGAVIQAFIMSWMHVQMRDKKKLPEVGNADIIEISGESKNWRVTKIYDGEAFRPANLNMMDGIKPFAFENLPPLPDFLKSQP